jgi:hypothetical protein
MGESTGPGSTARALLSPHLMVHGTSDPALQNAFLAGNSSLSARVGSVELGIEQDAESGSKIEPIAPADGPGLHEGKEIIIFEFTIQGDREGRTVLFRKKEAVSSTDP